MELTLGTVAVISVCVLAGAAGALTLLEWYFNERRR